MLEVIRKRTPCAGGCGRRVIISIDTKDLLPDGSVPEHLQKRCGNCAKKLKTGQDVMRKQTGVIHHPRPTGLTFEEQRCDVSMEQMGCRTMTQEEIVALEASLLPPMTTDEMKEARRDRTKNYVY